MRIFYARAADLIWSLYAAGSYGSRVTTIVPSSEAPVLDLMLLALGLGFFGLMAAYAAGCDRV